MPDKSRQPSLSLEAILKRTSSEELFAKVELPAEFKDQWVETEADRDFAWDLYTELRTRITTQPLHYLHGKEDVALRSMYELFPFVRKLIHEKGRAASKSIDLSLAMINKVVRPFTAKWDGRIVPGVPLREDAGNQFRRELDVLQGDLRTFTSLLACIALQEGYIPNTESWPTESAVKDIGKKVKELLPIPFAIQFHGSVSQEKANKIQEAERQAITKRREEIDPGSVSDGLHDVAGLAISGGGIRSASFALGVVQELSRHNVLQHFDYLSTVSGGGYLGSFLSSYLNGPPRRSNSPRSTTESTSQCDSDPSIGLGSNQLPLNRPGGIGGEESIQDAHRTESESGPLQHLRGHSKYLFTGGLQNRLSMLVLGAFGILANLIILLPIAAAILLSIVAIRPRAIESLRSHSRVSFFTAIVNDETSAWLLVSIPIMIVSLAVVLSIARFIRREEFTRCWLGIISYYVPIALLFVLWRMLPWSLVQAETVFQSRTGNGLSNWFTSIASLSTVVMFLQRCWSLLNANPSMSKLKRSINVLVLALFGPIFLFASLFLLAQFTILRPILGFTPQWSLAALTIVSLLFGWLFLDINQSSLHPFYRKKLSEAFLIARGDSVEAIVANDTLKLSEMRTHNKSGPYHLINAALNAPASDNGAMRMRGTDFFLFSQAYTGSASTDYFSTKEWEKCNSRLNLGTAMAISGAAASPVMGVVPLPSAKFLLALFNVRLDFWLAVPGRRTIPVVWWTPGPWYLIRQAIGWMNEKTTFINVSDGGHIENLGLYELLRRRCRYIVVIDGECDPKLECGAFMQAARFAKVDFGVEVAIDMNRFQTKEDGSARYHFSFGKIRYPELRAHEKGEWEGRLLYIKLSRTGNEPAGVEHYRLMNSDFPHQSTADQFFDEEQFEAYRCLGEHVAEDVFTLANLGDSDASYARLRELFQRLEQKLTDPNEI